MDSYIMALDAGTTSSRCILFDRKGAMIAMAQKELSQFFPRPGWVEQDGNEIWETQLAVAREAMQKAAVSADQIAAIGITNQRETTLVWNKESGEPIAPAIVWQCRRTAPICDALQEQGLGDLFHERTGLLLDAYFSGTKIKWILDEIPGARERAEAGSLLFGTVETWLIWKLTGGRIHATDVSNASRTLLCQLRTLQWDTELLEKLNIPACMLPEIRPSGGLFGKTDASLFGGEIPIAGAAGDQQAALFGQTCFAPGDVKNTYGTGGFILMNTGSGPVYSDHGLVTTVAWQIGNEVQYALEGSVFIAGAAIQWLRDELQLLPSASASEEMASRVSDTNGCYLVPAFTGLGAPYWEPEARGILVGLTRGVNRDHIVRATLEAMAFQTADVLDVMSCDGKIDLRALYVDGGASANNLLLQMQADFCQVPIYRPTCIETTALGAAYLAGLTVGFWESKETLQHNKQIDRTFVPVMTDELRRRKRKGWQKAVETAIYWTRGETAEARNRDGE